MMMKGEIYKKKIEEKKQEKQKNETLGCSFMPQVNKNPKFQRNPELKDKYNSNLSSGQVFSELHEKGALKEPRKDRSPIEIEFQKQQNECTFKPKLFFYSGIGKKQNLV